MKTISVKWRSNTRGSYGIVLAQNEIFQQAYMSLIAGYNEKIDRKEVMDWGFKLNYNEAVGFFGKLVDKELYKFK